MTTLIAENKHGPHAMFEDIARTPPTRFENFRLDSRIKVKRI